MTAARFFNALRIMHSIDRQELIDASVIREGDDDGEWIAFRQAPCRAALKMDELRQARLFALIERRQPGGAS